MNTQVQNAPVTLTPEQVANLKKVQQQLEQTGEVKVQTAEDVGTEQLPKSQTVH